MRSDRANDIEVGRSTSGEAVIYVHFDTDSDDTSSIGFILSERQIATVILRLQEIEVTNTRQKEYEQSRTDGTRCLR